MYVERPVHDALVRKLVEKTETIAVGDPLDRQNWLGPLINERAVSAIARRVPRRDATARLATGGEI